MSTSCGRSWSRGWRGTARSTYGISRPRTCSGSGRRSRKSAKLLVSALRSLLGFWHVHGLIGRPLAGVVPSVAGWRLAGLPRALEADQVRALLDSCDRLTVAGMRDFAILTMLVRLGMRRGEVASLRLDDINWRAGEI